MNAATAGLAALLTLVLAACTHADSQTTGATATHTERRADNLAYPGAEAMTPATFVPADSGLKHTIAGFTTTDPFEKVYDYYHHRLPPQSETMRVVTANGSVATFSVAKAGDGQTIAVQISSDKPNETEILITRPRR